jgi:iron complex outermembrane recepter protein
MLKQTFASLTFMCATSAWAFPADLLSEADYFAEQPVVLSASKLSQPLNRAPAAVTVITREMIEASGLRHLVDVLRLVPGFVVGWSGGNTPAATYLGLSQAYPRWMQIMVDGRSVYNPGYGQTNWRGIPLTLDEVDRIEVVRGSNAANDGLNSLSGTIHIYTRHAATTQGGMGEIALGDKQFREANVRVGAQTATGNWRLGLLGREDQIHGVAQDHASDVQLSFRGDFQPTHRDTLLVQAGASRGLWQGTNVAVLLSNDQHATYQNRYAQVQWDRVLDEGWEWSLQVHHAVHLNEEAMTLPAFLDPIDGNYRTSGSGVQLTVLDRSASVLRTSFSGEYRLNKAYLDALPNGDAGVKDNIVRLSGALEWNPAPEWVVHAAAMLEHHDNPDGTYLSPRLAVNWLPSGEHAFRVGVSQGLSAVGSYASDSDIKTTVNGQLFDQMFLGLGKLDPEKVTVTELGYLYNKPEWGLKLDTRVFHNSFDDLLGLEIIAVPGDVVDGVARTYVNNTTATQRGLEYQLMVRPSRNGWLVLSQSWVATDSNNESYPRSAPRHTLSLLAAHPVAGVDVSLGYYHISTMRWLQAESDSQYDRLDLRLAKDWKTADGKLVAALVIQGLLGEHIESFRFYDQQSFDRRGYLSLKYEFR